MTIRLTTPPATEPVTAAEFEEKAWLSSGFDSTTVTRAIAAAREHVEKETDRSLITQGWTMTLDNWSRNSGSVIFLPKGPVIDITSMTYVDTSGNTQALTKDTQYTLGSNGEVATITPIGSWPAVSQKQKEVIKIVYTAGYGAATDVPSSLIAGIVSLAQNYYTNGEIDNTKMTESLIKNYKIYFNYSIND